MVLNFRDAVRWQWKKVNISIKSLFYNHFMDQGYIADVCMEPMFWFVDNFTKFLGPVSIIYHWHLHATHLLSNLNNLLCILWNECTKTSHGIACNKERQIVCMIA